MAIVESCPWSWAARRRIGSTDFFTIAIESHTRDRGAIARYLVAPKDRQPVAHAIACRVVGRCDERLGVVVDGDDPPGAQFQGGD